eukprot:2047605-Rhodomonas_salina.1
MCTCVYACPHSTDEGSSYQVVDGTLVGLPQPFEYRQVLGRRKPHVLVQTYPRLVPASTNGIPSLVAARVGRYLGGSRSRYGHWQLHDRGSVAEYLGAA